MDCGHRRERLSTAKGTATWRSSCVRSAGQLSLRYGASKRLDGLRSRVGECCGCGYRRKEGLRRQVHRFTVHRSEIDPVLFWEAGASSMASRRSLIRASPTLPSRRSFATLSTAPTSTAYRSSGSTTPRSCFRHGNAAEIQLLPSAPLPLFGGQHVADATQCQIVSGSEAGDHAVTTRAVSDTGAAPHRVRDVDFDRRKRT